MVQKFGGQVLVIGDSLYKLTLFCSEGKVLRPEKIRGTIMV